MEKTNMDPDSFITAQPELLRSELERLDAVLRKAMSGHSRVMWEGR